MDPDAGLRGYRDRVEAGERLARSLTDLPGDALILGIPRGGVVVADAAARDLGLELDVITAGKVRAPTQPELAIGAVGPDGTPVLDERVVAMLGGVSEVYLREEVTRRADEVAGRMMRYRGDRPPFRVTDRACVVIDDGIATGSTARAALLWLKRVGAGHVVLAVPVAPPRSVSELAEIADRVECPLVTARFIAVGQFYDRFDQVSDEEVARILTEAYARRG